MTRSASLVLVSGLLLGSLLPGCGALILGVTGDYKPSSSRHEGEASIVVGSESEGTMVFASSSTRAPELVGLAPVVLSLQYEETVRGDPVHAMPFALALVVDAAASTAAIYFSATADDELTSIVLTPFSVLLGVGLVGANIAIMEKRGRVTRERVYQPLEVVALEPGNLPVHRRVPKSPKALLPAAIRLDPREWRTKEGADAGFTKLPSLEETYQRRWTAETLEYKMVERLFDLCPKVVSVSPRPRIAPGDFDGVLEDVRKALEAGADPNLLVIDGFSCRVTQVVTRTREQVTAIAMISRANEGRIVSRYDGGDSMLDIAKSRSANELAALLISYGAR